MEDLQLDYKYHTDDECVCQGVLKQDVRIYEDVVRDSLQQDCGELQVQQLKSCSYNAMNNSHARRTANLLMP